MRYYCLERFNKYSARCQWPGVFVFCRSFLSNREGAAAGDNHTSSALYEYKTTIAATRASIHYIQQFLLFSLQHHSLFFDHLSFVYCAFPIFLYFFLPSLPPSKLKPVFTQSLDLHRLRVYYTTKQSTSQARQAPAPNLHLPDTPAQVTLSGCFRRASPAQQSYPSWLLFVSGFQFPPKIHRLANTGSLHS